MYSVIHDNMHKFQLSIDALGWYGKKLKATTVLFYGQTVLPMYLFSFCLTFVSYHKSKTITVHRWLCLELIYQLLTCKYLICEDKSPFT